MKQFILFSIYILVLGCGPEYYVPNSQNIPIMKSKDQTNLGFGYNESEYTRGFELQAAHAISNHIALQLNGDWIKNKKNSYLGESPDNFKATGSMLEVGAGYFKNIASNFTFETYGLLCFGTVKYENFTTSGFQNFSAKFNRLGVQPSLSYSRKHFSSSLSSRIVHLQYSNINGDTNSPDFDPNYLKTNNAYWLLEPAITIQVGSENLKFKIQYVYSYNLTNPSFEQEIDIISLGIKLNINPPKQMTTLKK